MYAVLIEIDDSCKDYHTKYTRSTPVVDSRGKVYDTVKEAMDDAKWYVKHIAMGCVSIRNSDGFKMADDGLSFVASNGNLMGKASVVKLERILDMKDNLYQLLKSCAKDIQDIAYQSAKDKMFREYMDRHIESLKKTTRNRVKFIIGKNLKF